MRMLFPMRLLEKKIEKNIFQQPVKFNKMGMQFENLVLLKKLKLKKISPFRNFIKIKKARIRIRAFINIGCYQATFRDCESSVFDGIFPGANFESFISAPENIKLS